MDSPQKQPAAVSRRPPRPWLTIVIHYLLIPQEMPRPRGGLEPSMPVPRLAYQIETHLAYRTVTPGVWPSQRPYAGESPTSPASQARLRPTKRLTVGPVKFPRVLARTTQGSWHQTARIQTLKQGKQWGQLESTRSEVGEVFTKAVIPIPRS